MSSVDVASVASSLEEAAKSVKLLTQFTGAHELNINVKELTEQVQTLHGTVTKQHSELMAAVEKMNREQCTLLKEKMSADTRANALLLKVAQANVHREMVKNMKEKNAYQVSQNDKDIIIFTASSYGWKIGENLKNYGKDESDEEKKQRRWPDALDCLEIVTVPSLSRGKGEAYSTFVCG